MIAVAFAITFHEPLLISLGQLLVENDPPRKVDIIVVMGGDFWGSRVRTGADLANRGFAQKVLFSGPLYGSGSYEAKPEGEYAIEKLVRDGYRRELFESLLISGHSTIEEVKEVVEELDTRQMRQILVVTSSYHSRRACTAFRLYAPHLQVSCVASADPAFSLVHWWAYPNQRSRVSSELFKLVGTWILCLPYSLLSVA